MTPPSTDDKRPPSKAESENNAFSKPLQHSYNLFQEPWWLDAVAPGDWSEAVVRRGTEIAARLPFVHKRRLGLTLLTQPSLTPNLGPWLRTTDGKYSKRLADEKDLMGELIESLPKADLFRQTFHPSITNWLPFRWAGFEASVVCTYRIEDLSDLDGVWKEFQSNVRTDVQKAKKTVVLRDDLNLDKLLDVVELTFGRQGKSLSFPREVVYRLDQACRERNCSRMFFAEDAQGRIHAVAYVVWDCQSAYYLLGGGDPALRNSGATSLILWEAIQYAARVTKAFDFEGSQIEGVERFFRGFGARQTTALSILRLGRRLRALAGARDLMVALFGVKLPRIR